MGGLGRMRLCDFFSEKCIETPSSQSSSFLTSVVGISPPPLFIGGNCQVGKEKKKKKASRNTACPSCHRPRHSGWASAPAAVRSDTVGRVKSRHLHFLPPPDPLPPLPLCPHQNKVVFSKGLPRGRANSQQLVSRGLEVPEAQGTAEPRSHSILLGCIPHHTCCTTCSSHFQAAA